MIADALEQIAWDFAAFTRAMIAVDDRQDDLDEPVSYLAALTRRLYAVVSDPGEDSSCTRIILTKIALMEAKAVQDHVAWLLQHGDSEEKREVVRRLTLAASQGWTAIEILQRAHA